MSQSNKVILVVLAVLAAGLLFLVLGSGACSGSGGGGSMVNGGFAAKPSGTSEEIGVSNADNGTNDSQEESYDAIKEKLADKLERKNDPVGSNPRVATSEESSIPTVQEAYTAIDERGFGDNFVLSASYTVNGDYISNTNLERTLHEKYPSYSGSYVSKNGIVWTLVINGGKVFATPIGAKDGSIAKGIVLSEGDVITQYDGKTNQYSDFSLSDLSATESVGIKVHRIDSSTLDSYTLEDLSRM